MPSFKSCLRLSRRSLRPVLAAAALLALTGCVVAPAGGYYGAAAPAYPAPAYSYPAYAAYPGYYAAAPVGVVVGGGWGWGGGWRRWH